jgi:hypothetical protein
MPEEDAIAAAVAAVAGRGDFEREECRAEEGPAEASWWRAERREEGIADPPGAGDAARRAASFVLAAALLAAFVACICACAAASSTVSIGSTS